MRKILFLIFFTTLVFADFIRDDKLDIVYDTDKNIVWQDDISVIFDMENLRKADEYCEDLEYSGYADWRLPSLTELLSITNTKTSPSINSVFKNVKKTRYWSFTKLYDDNDEDYAYAVNFDDSSYRLEDEDNKHYIRCVRGLAFNKYDSFKVDYSAKVIKDNSSGLMWEDNKFTKRMNFESAKEYCENLNLASKCDWRLPTIDELWSIVDFSKESLTVYDVFKNSIKKGFYWSESADISNKKYIRVILFADGSHGWTKKNAKGYVRCVRSMSIPF